MKESMDFEKKELFEIGSPILAQEMESAQLQEIDDKYNNLFEEQQSVNEQASTQEKKAKKGSKISQQLDNLLKEKEEKAELNAQTEFNIRMAELRLSLQESNSRLLHVPERTALSEGYSSAFSSKYSERKRAAKQNNKRSRLYKKRQNAEMINQKAKEVLDSSFALLSYALPEEYADYDVADREEMRDLSAFMSTRDVESNKEILKLYFGKGVRQDKDEIHKSMDMMLQKILSEDLSTIQLDNDKVIADNAKRLELLTNRVAAFDRLAQRHDYFVRMDEETKKGITEKLDKVRSIANYYSLKKEIINDPLYMKSYNDELSMDFTGTDDPEKQELAKKLLRAYVVGEDMMAKNGATEELKKGRRPIFKDEKEGRRFMREQEYILELHHDDELLREKYVKVNTRAYTSEVFKKNKGYVRMIQNTTDYVNSYEGKWHERPGYVDEGYDEKKVKGYFEELDNIKLTDFEFSSYRSMAINMKKNYELCERTDRLWFEIARALDHGYNDDSIDDKKLMEIRAKTNLIQSMRTTFDMIAKKLYNEPECADYTDEEWKKEFSFYENCKNDKGGIIHVSYCGDPQKLLDLWMKDVVAEDATKEQSIKEAYPYIMAKDKDYQIPQEELEKRKASYNRNAIIQDYLNKDFIRNSISEMSGIKSVFVQDRIRENRNETRDEFRKRVGGRSQRMLSAMIVGRGAAEVERLCRLYDGSQEDQLEFYNELIKDAFSVPFNDLMVKEGDSILDNMHKKYRVARISANISDIIDIIKKLFERNPELQLKIPGGYASLEEMEKDIKAVYDVGCDLMSPHLLTYQQIPSSKWLHGFNVRDLGTLDKDRLKKINDYADGFSDEYSLFTQGILSILKHMTFINRDNEFDPNGIYNLDTDIEDIYKKLREKAGLKN